MAITHYTLRERGVETDLTEEALDAFIAAAEADVRQVAGPVGPRVEAFTTYPRTSLLFLSQPATTITELRAGDTLTSLAVVPSTEYRLRPNGYIVERYDAEQWPRRVEVTYQPADDLALRESVVLQLVKLALAYEGLRGSAGGDFRVEHVEYPAERERILSRLQGGRLPLA
jgi:hypothetical protein